MAKGISIDEAKPEKLFYVVTTVVVYRNSDGRCLILKRDEREKVHSGKWGVPGGKFEHADLDINHPTKINDGVAEFANAVNDVAKREVFEEAGVKVSDDLQALGILPFIRPDAVPVVLIKLAAQYVSGDVVLEKGAFTDSAWVNNAEAKNYDLIEGVADEIAQTINLFS